MATGQASTKPPDANEYGGGVSPDGRPRNPFPETDGELQTRYRRWC